MHRCPTCTAPVEHSPPDGDLRYHPHAAEKSGARAERERCAKVVAEMRNQRDAYRKIIGDPAAQLPKHGHWADPFFEEAERDGLPTWATELAERAYLTPGSPVNAFAQALVAAKAEDGRLILEQCGPRPGEAWTREALRTCELIASRIRAIRAENSDDVGDAQ